MAYLPGWLGTSQEDEEHDLFAKDGVLKLYICTILTWHYPEDEIIRVKKKEGRGYVNMNGATATCYVPNAWEM